MVTAADLLRRFWVTGINEVTIVSGGVSDWICERKYAIHSQVANENFWLTPVNRTELIAAMAGDCNRMATAAFESMTLQTQNARIPKSLGWTAIKAYYSAFFAAHALLRMAGVACSQLNSNAATSVNSVAAMWGQGNGVSVGSGFHACRFDPSSGVLHCAKPTGGGGVHEQAWSVFADHIRHLSSELLNGPASYEAQSLSVKLDDLLTILSSNNVSRGSWLSSIRNAINYRHEHAVWFPYDGQRRKLISDVKNLSETWLRDPLRIDIQVGGGGAELSKFFLACGFIVSLCRDLVEDMSDRCSAGTSFLTTGAVRLLKQTRHSKVG